MHAKFLKAAAAMFVGAAILVSPVASKADDAGLNEPGGAFFDASWSDTWSSQYNQLSEMPRHMQAPASAEAQGYFFMANPHYPHDFPDGGSD